MCRVAWCAGAAGAVFVGRLGAVVGECASGRWRSRFPGPAQLMCDVLPHPFRGRGRQIRRLYGACGDHDTPRPVQLVPATVAYGDVPQSAGVVARSVVAQCQSHQVRGLDVCHRTLQFLGLRRCLAVPVPGDVRARLRPACSPRLRPGLRRDDQVGQVATLFGDERGRAGDECESRGGRSGGTSRTEGRPSRPSNATPRDRPPARRRRAVLRPGLLAVRRRVRRTRRGRRCRRPRAPRVRPTLGGRRAPVRSGTTRRRRDPRGRPWRPAR